MAERDKVIKSGQLTIPRILFLAAVGGIIVFTVYSGGIFLSIGYWFLTLAICALLFLIAIDYGVKMDKVDLTAAVPVAASPEATTASVPGLKAGAAEARPKRRSTGRPAKRRR